MATLFLITSLIIVVAVYSTQFPECTDSIAVDCDGGFPTVLCIAASTEECFGIELIGSPLLRKLDTGKVVAMMKSPDSPIGKAMITADKYFKCYLSRFDVNDLLQISIIKNTCAADKSKKFQISASQWGSECLPEYKQIKQKRQDREEQQELEETRKLFASQSKDAKKAHKKMKKSYSTRKIQYLLTNSYKSVQGMKGDCVMHSLNNILNGKYFTNHVMGQVFGKGLPSLKVYKKTQKEEEKQAKENKTPSNLISVYKNKAKQGEPDYYEAFGKPVINKALSTIGAEETQFVFDFDKKDIKDLAHQLTTLRKTPNLIGLRTSYSSSEAGRHSVGIRFTDFSKEYKKEKDKHWLWIQSWLSYAKILLTDEELAKYLFDTMVHKTKKKTYGKFIYYMTIKGGRQLLPVPNKAISKSDVKLKAYYECLPKLKDTDPFKVYQCENEAKKAKAMREYENNYNLYYDSNEEEELEEMREIKILNRLRFAEQRLVNDLKRKHHAIPTRK